MTLEEYYIAPTDEVFNEIKAVACDIWREYGKDLKSFDYMIEKLGRVVGLQNIQDNAWVIVNMFDQVNQRKMLERVSLDTRLMILYAIHAEHN